MKQYPEQSISYADRITPVRLSRQSGDSFEVPDECFYMAYRGSVAHGTYCKPENNGIDDIDLMGFVVGKKSDYLGLSQWGSKGTKEIKSGSYDVVLYEAKKAFQLLLQGNPNIMSMLWVKPEDCLKMDRWATEMRLQRRFFSGKHVYNSFAGYAHAQLLKMESRDPAELREYLAVTAELKRRGAHPNHKGETVEPSAFTSLIPGEMKNCAATSTDILLQKLKHYHKKGENLGWMGEKRKILVLEHQFDCKNASHTIRLLRMCKEFMETGELIVDRSDIDAKELLDIKRGKWKLEDIRNLSKDLFEDAKQSMDRSSLPDGPNKQMVELLLIDIIQSKVIG